MEVALVSSLLVGSASNKRDCNTGPPTGFLPSKMSSLSCLSSSLSADENVGPGLWGCELNGESRRYEVKEQDDILEHFLYLRTVSLGEDANDEPHVVAVESKNMSSVLKPITVASLRPSVLPMISLDDFELIPPVVFILKSGTGPVYLNGQHVICPSTGYCPDRMRSLPHLSSSLSAGEKPVTVLWGCELNDRSKRYEVKEEDDLLEHLLYLRTVSLGEDADDEPHAVAVESKNMTSVLRPIPIALLRPSILPMISFDCFELIPPVAFILKSGTGPVHLNGQHIILDDGSDYEPSEENFLTDADTGESSYSENEVQFNAEAEAKGQSQAEEASNER
ncbi:uncharacterized protein LOC133368407 [Rhineura floridana]|uniref:uncharacterized protein LOC133368407 n=1 Tax=Rhineura floridana TaxID=261503 RepID=UPI002AC87E41|nr:uncharacterized protein LOC133368407 [Rhineura floridana]